MKTIEQRAEEWYKYIAENTTYDVDVAKYSYFAGAKDQKVIDDAELRKLKSSWEKGAEISHDAENACECTKASTEEFGEIAMRSILERAKEAYPAHEYSVLERTMKRGAYIRGAKDQKAIDIEKAKTAFSKSCGWLSTYPWYNEVFEEFIKNIEE